MDSPRLTDRWVAAEWSDSNYSAVIPNFIDPAQNIQITLELDSAGKCEWILYARGQVYGSGIAANKEDAAQEGLRDVRRLFHNSRKNAPYILSFLPVMPDRFIAKELDAYPSSVCEWRIGKINMSKRSVNLAMKMLGMNFHARGGGEFIALEPPAWHLPSWNPVPPARGHGAKKGRPRKRLPDDTFAEGIERGRKKTLDGQDQS